jgi:type I restriction enzyme S subunit
MMQKLFPKKGEKVPELRFPGFSGDWEEKKLGEESKIVTGKLDANAMKHNGKFRFYTCAKDYYKIDEYAFDCEALLISGNGANVGYIHHYKGKFNAYQRTYVISKLKHDYYFTKYFLEKNLKYRIRKERKEGNTPYIVLSTLFQMIVLYPTNQEQNLISNFLVNLDTKIENLDCKIAEMKEWKKGLMQRMFV